MVDLEPLRAFKEPNAFRPFVVHMREGERITVKRWEMFMVSPRGKTFFAFDQKDRMRIVDADAIVNIEFPSKPPRSRQKKG